MHAIPVKIRAAPSALCADAFREHLDGLIEIRPGEIAIAVRPPNTRKQIVLPPVVGRRNGHDLLGQHIQRRSGNEEPIELAGGNRPHQRGALDQLVASGREDAPLRLGRVLHVVTGTPDALERDGDRARRSDLAHQVHGADVDAELERCRGDDGLQLSFFQSFFAGESQLARQASVVRQHGIVAKAIAKMMRHALGEPPGVHEHERRPVLVDQDGQPIVNLLPHLVRRHRAKFVVRHLHCEIHRAAVTVIDHGDAGCFIRRQEPRYCFDGANGGGQSDPLRRPAAGLFHQVVEPGKRQRQMRAPLVIRHRVNLIDNHGAHVPQRSAASLRGQQNEQRLRCGHQDVRRTLDHLPPLGRRGIAGPHRRSDGRQQQSALCGKRGDAGQRHIQVLVDVVAERLQR